MVDAKGQGNLLYLPLDKLMQATAAATAAQNGSVDVTSTQSVAPKPAAPATADAPPQLDRSLNNSETRREPSLRSRDRESR
jgi:membrane protease subunit HflK